jgi:hypothetical protein
VAAQCIEAVSRSTRRGHVSSSRDAWDRPFLQRRGDNPLRAPRRFEPELPLHTNSLRARVNSDMLQAQYPGTLDVAGDARSQRVKFVTPLTISLRQPCVGALPYAVRVGGVTLG